MVVTDKVTSSEGYTHECRHLGAEPDTLNSDYPSFELQYNNTQPAIKLLLCPQFRISIIFLTTNYMRANCPKLAYAVPTITFCLLVFIFRRCAAQQPRCSNTNTCEQGVRNVNWALLFTTYLAQFSHPENGGSMFLRNIWLYRDYYYYYYYYRYSALGPVWAETRAQSRDWYSSGTLHPGQVLRGRLPLLSPIYIYIYIKHRSFIYLFSIFGRSHFRYQVPPRPSWRERS